MRRCRRLLFLLLLLGIVGCAIPPTPPLERLPLRPVPAQRVLPMVDDMAYDGLEEAIEQSLVYLRRVPPERQFAFGKDLYSTSHMILSLETFREFLRTRPSAESLAEFIRSRFRIYASAGSEESGQVLFTGYYEPSLRGSREKSDRYRFPVYARPYDLVSIDLSLFHPRYSGERIVARIEDRKVVPYHDREQIFYEGRLEGKAEVLAWVDDEVDLFFLQVQGSGRICLDTGEELHVQYHESNGHPYRSIGKLLLEEGKIDRSEMSMQRIRAYLQQNPEQMRRILSYNPSYVFFRTVDQGPIGAIGVRLTPARSIATDRRLFPDAALGFIRTQKPLVNGSGQISQWSEMHRFVLNQDTGGAIRGAGRADQFWGSGDYAELAAGHMQHTGQLFFLVLSPSSP